jgi:hypothetical protein
MITLVMPYLVFGGLWHSFRHKGTKYLAAAASVCSVVGVLFSAA